MFKGHRASSPRTVSPAIRNDVLPPAALNDDTLSSWDFGFADQRAAFANLNEDPLPGSWQYDGESRNPSLSNGASLLFDGLVLRPEEPSVEEGASGTSPHGVSAVSPSSSVSIEDVDNDTDTDDVASTLSDTFLADSGSNTETPLPQLPALTDYSESLPTPSERVETKRTHSRPPVYKSDAPVKKARRMSKENTSPSRHNRAVKQEAQEEVPSFAKVVNQMKVAESKDPVSVTIRTPQPGEVIKPNYGPIVELAQRIRKLDDYSEIADDGSAHAGPLHPTIVRASGTKAANIDDERRWIRFAAKGALHTRDPATKKPSHPWYPIYEDIAKSLKEVENGRKKIGSKWFPQYDKMRFSEELAPILDALKRLDPLIPADELKAHDPSCCQSSCKCDAQAWRIMQLFFIYLSEEGPKWGGHGKHPDSATYQRFSDWVVTPVQ
eukprot:TRINITY_DN259_c0_g1_i2.p1 TRINITY_DN259_c0_g1~~TRINITY_DN259_c0_g1_i2.p1  ORF type:complete len:438 (-),score=118.64 TRINITY_DN259_c0_g1_i2:295-1608(-)